MAEEAAIKITKPLHEKANAIKGKLQEYVTVQAERQVPAPVMALYSTHPRYVHTSGSQYFDQLGDRVTFTRDVPTLRNRSALDLTDKISDQMLKLNHEYKDAIQIWKETKIQIEITLVNLRTYNRVKDQMPEALPFLPAPGTTTTAIALPLQPLRNTIKKLAKAATA